MTFADEIGSCADNYSSYLSINGELVLGECDNLTYDTEN